MEDRRTGGPEKKSGLFLLRYSGPPYEQVAGHSPGTPPICPLAAMSPLVGELALA